MASSPSGQVLLLGGAGQALLREDLLTGILGPGLLGRGGRLVRGGVAE